MISEPMEMAKWIEDEVLPLSTSEFKMSGCPIGHCIPPKFESYCKIYHPFEVTPDEPDILEPDKDYRKPVSITFLRDPEKVTKITMTKNDGTVIDLFEEHKERLKDYHSKKWIFTAWKTIADKYGLLFHNEINTETYVNKFQEIGWPKNLAFPGEGQLPRKNLMDHLGVLEKESTAGEVFIYQKIPHSIYKDNRYDDLVRCSYEEVLGYFDKDFAGYLYSADKSWIVFTDTDQHFTIVGGDKRLIRSLATCDLEVLECTKDTRVDEHSDRINRKR